VAVTDYRLILDCLAGQTASFGELVTRYEGRLYNAAYRLLDNGEDARDVVQDSFLHAYQSLHSFRGDSQFYTWIYRIVVNTAISLKRKQRGALRFHAGLIGPDFIDPTDSSPTSQPSHALEAAEEESRIQLALRRLSAEHRIVLVMKDMEGFKYEEMAQILSVPIGTIRSRLHRARLELREVLQSADGWPEEIGS